MGDFKRLDFNDQVATIANDIKEHFWREDGKWTVIKNVASHEAKKF